MIERSPNFLIKHPMTSVIKFLSYFPLVILVTAPVMPKAVPHNKCQINNTEYYQKIPFY